MKHKPIPYDEDKANIIGVNNGHMSRAHWNLLCSIRDVKLFCAGIKPHRFWRLKDVKYYFGVTGGKEKVLEQLLKMYKEIEDVKESKV